MTYGALRLDYHIAPKSLFNAVISTDLAAGFINEKKLDAEGNSLGKENRVIRIVEPEIMGMVNVNKYFRMGAGYSYRIVRDNASQLSDGEVDGGSFLLAFQLFELSSSAPETFAH